MEKIRKIKAKGKFEIDVKRFYLPIKFSLKCPKCGEKLKFNLDDNYMSFPVVNDKDEHIGGYCGKCESDLLVNVELKISLNVNEDSIMVDEL